MILIFTKISALAASQLLKYTSAPGSRSPGPLHLLLVCEGNNLGPPPAPSASHPFANVPSCTKSDHFQRVLCLTCTTRPRRITFSALHAGDAIRRSGDVIRCSGKVVLCCEERGGRRPPSLGTVSPGRLAGRDGLPSLGANGFSFLDVINP